jgi:hypothetical protein
MVIDEQKGITYFCSLEQAVKKTNVSEKRILACIKNGQRWKGCYFDLA